MNNNGIEKLPPHNTEAEEAILGALLIDPDAIFEVSTFLRADAFYRQQNQWIYEAMLDLYNQREPVDLVTLIEQLRKQERLDAVGGETYVIGLLNAVPTSVNARSYGRIVEAAAVRRRLLAAATVVANLAYDEAEDINVVIDRSESALFSVSEARSARDLVAVKDIARAYMDRLQELSARGDDVTGVPTGFTDMDRLLGGLNKSDLVIIAGRPGMGKTSLLMNVALTAGRRYGKRVALFNMEMSGEQLVARMIASETKIDSQRLRRGQLQEHEWPIFYEAIGRLSESRIFIDDTPSINPMQLRTKCRRLYAEHGLDLVMIDYLQLMQAERNVSNRVQEISEISRQLKGLARELDVPVVALAQLSRAVEQRQDKRPMLSDLRDSGCLTGDTLVTMAETGRRVPIRELIGRCDFDVWALNEESLTLERAGVSRAFSTGVKPVFRLKTQLGRTIRATANHKFRSFDGWRRLDELHVGDRLALPRLIPEIPGNQTVSDAELALLGHLTGTSIYKQNVSRERAARVAHVVDSRPLVALANSDIYWDRIVSIELDGEEEVFDLTVPGPHNFVANDIFVHNSIEQDADVVCFIYRDEYYNPDTTERPNIAEISIAKHRHGPTGVVDLYWHSQLATFRNLQRQEIQL